MKDKMQAIFRKILLSCCNLRTFTELRIQWDTLPVRVQIPPLALFFDIFQLLSNLYLLTILCKTLQDTEFLKKISADKVKEVCIDMKEGLRKVEVYRRKMLLGFIPSISCYVMFPQNLTKSPSLLDNKCPF